MLWQLNLTRFSDIDRVIALALIDAIDTDGRLTQTPEGIHADLAIDGVDLEEVLAVLHRLQHFEPSGLVCGRLAGVSAHTAPSTAALPRHLETLPER